MAETDHAHGAADAGHHHQHGAQARACCGGEHGGGDQAGATAIDPVCGMSVKRETAKHRFAYKGQDYFFCGARCRERFSYLLVDEFQDTNRIQLELIRLLAADNFGNVSAVGDAKQSIYGWRDAEIENIRTRFPGRRLPLTHNRRSYQEILDCATDFIRRDPDFAAEPDLVATLGAANRPVTVVVTLSSLLVALTSCATGPLSVMSTVMVAMRPASPGLSTARRISVTSGAPQ